MMNYYAFVGLFNSIVVSLIGFYFLLKKIRLPLYRSFSFFCLSVGFWQIFYVGWQIQTQKEGALLFIRATEVGSYFIPFSFLWFVYCLINRSVTKKQAIRLALFPLFFTSLSYTSLLVKNVMPKMGFPFWPVPGLLMHSFVAVFFIIVIYSFALLFSAFAKTKGLQRWQIGWVIALMLPGWIGGSTNWLLWYDIPMPPTPNFFVGVSFLAMAYVIFRSRLFDIDTLADWIQEAKLSALGIMATSINHEVRNPLFVIKGLAEILLERPDADPAKIKDIAQRAVVQADRALEIIRNFSEYAKRQSSKTFDKQSLDINEVFESIVPLVCSELALERIRLHVNVPPKAMVCADRHSLEEIFINLIVNACQAMPGGGEIEILTKEEKPLLFIKVRDTGPGVPQEQLARIFEPFYTTKASGTGLGLYVVKQLVEKNGGKVEVLSKEGLGTTFSLIFPQ
jgi:signal transduction histidine kinase